MTDNIFYIFFSVVVILSIIIVYSRRGENKPLQSDKESPSPIKSKRVSKEVKNDDNLLQDSDNEMHDFFMNKLEDVLGEIQSEGLDLDEIEEEASYSALSEDQKYWLELLNMRVDAMPLDSAKTMGYTIKKLANEHFNEYKANEANVPKNKRKSVASNRLKGFSSIRDVVKKHGTEELNFHFEASFLGASLYNDSVLNMKSKSKDRKFVKSSAIDFVNNKNGFSKLNNSNTSFSNINKTNPVFWINADPNKLSKEFNIICIDKNELIWFNIPQGEFNDPDKQFYIRKDNGKVHIEIPIKGENDYLNDIKNGVKLKKYARIYKIK